MSHETEILGGCCRFDEDIFGSPVNDQAPDGPYRYNPTTLTILNRYNQKHGTQIQLIDLYVLYRGDINMNKGRDFPDANKEIQDIPLKDIKEILAHLEEIMVFTRRFVRFHGITLDEYRQVELSLKPIFQKAIPRGSLGSIQKTHEILGKIVNHERKAIDPNQEIFRDFFRIQSFLDFILEKILLGIQMRENLG